MKYVRVNWDKEKLLFAANEVVTLEMLSLAMEHKLNIPKELHVYFIHISYPLDANSYAEKIKKDKFENLDLYFYVKGTTDEHVIKRCAKLEINRNLEPIIVRDASSVRVLTFHPLLNSKVSDLKEEIYQKTGVQHNHQVFHRRRSGQNDLLIHNSDLFLTDLFLDQGKLDTNIKFRLMINSTGLTIEERGHYMEHFRPFAFKFIPFIHVIIPKIDTDEIVDYSFLEAISSTLGDVKSWIQQRFDIPKDEQLLLVNGNFFDDGCFLDVLFEINLNRQVEPMEIKVFVYATKDEELMKVYIENNIATLNPVQVMNSCTKKIIFTYYYDNRFKENSLENFIEENFSIPITNQVFFWNGRYLWKFEELLHQVFEGLIPRNSELNICLAVHLDDSTSSTFVKEEILSKGISCMRNVVITHANGDTKIGEYPLSMTVDSVKYKVGIHHGINHKAIDFIYKDRILTETDVFYNLLFSEGNDSEDLFVTFLLNTSADKRALYFCERVKVSFLKTIEVQFLTQTISIDACFHEVGDISDLKNAIQKDKAILKTLQKIYFRKEELSNDVKLSSLLVDNNLTTAETISFSMLVTSPKTVHFNLECEFPLDNYSIEISETAQVSELREMISNLSHIPKSQIAIEHRTFDEKKEEQQIWQFGWKYSIKVFKQINLIIHLNETEQIPWAHEVFDWNESTVESMRYRIAHLYKFSREPGKTLVFKKESNAKSISKGTLLKDIGEEIVVFHLVDKSSGCVVC